MSAKPQSRAAASFRGPHCMEGKETLRSAIETLDVAQRLISGLAPLPAIDISQGIDLYEEVNRFEKGLIETALRHTNGSQIRASRLLGINPTTLNSKINRHGIDVKDAVHPLKPLPTILTTP